MKRTIIPFERVAGFYPLYNAWIKVSRGNGKDKRKDVIAYCEHVDDNLRDLSARLVNGTWRPDKGRTFMLYTEGKWRKIHVVNVETRIVYQSLVDAFQFQKLFTNRTFGSIKKRGTLKANKQVRRDLYRHPELDYVVKTDFHHYYQNIIKSKLMDKVRRKYKGSAAIHLLELCLDAYLPGSLRGISIGAVTSQGLGNLYLDEFDRYIMSELHCGCMARNVDDTTILCRHEDGARIIESLKRKAAELGLTYSKMEFYPVAARRIDFCGWAVNRDGARVRKSTVTRYKKRLNRMQRYLERINRTMSVVGSYEGILKHGNAYNLTLKIHKDYDQVFSRINRYSAHRRSKECTHAVA